MRRDLNLIHNVLQTVADNEDKGQPTVFAPENIENDIIRKSFTYNVKMLVENGFLRKIAEQADYQGTDFYHITWKGLCMLDMIEILYTFRG